MLLFVFFYFFLFEQMDLSSCTRTTVKRLNRRRRGVDTDLWLSTVRGQILAEDDGGSSGDPDRKVRQDWRQDGPSLLMPPDAEQRHMQELARMFNKYSNMCIRQTVNNSFALMYH